MADQGTLKTEGLTSVYTLDISPSITDIALITPASNDIFSFTIPEISIGIGSIPSIPPLPVGAKVDLKFTCPGFPACKRDPKLGACTKITKAEKTVDVAKSLIPPIKLPPVVTALKKVTLFGGLIVKIRYFATPSDESEFGKMGQPIKLIMHVIPDIVNPLKCPNYDKKQPVI